MYNYNGQAKFKKYLNASLTKVVESDKHFPLIPIKIEDLKHLMKNYKSPAKI